MAKEFYVAVLCSLFLFFLSNFPHGIGAVEVVKNLRNHPVEIGEAVHLATGEMESEETDDDEEDVEYVTDWESHPCKRQCEEGKPMTCRYYFTLEYYSTMSKACYDCPYNMTQCNLKHCVTGDGVKRTILVVNRQMPGPVLDLCHGDTVEVEVTNRMLDISTTIHWHGLFQKETPFMDGVPFVSQCLIAPQGSFLYRFYADNPGTHFWHAHSALQRGDGIYGPLIVRVPPDQDPHSSLYDFDLPEHVVNILDWEHMLSAAKFVAHYHSTGDNKPPSILVNGKGRFQEFNDGGNIIYTPAEKFSVKVGGRYRFRLINAGFLNCPIEMTIDNHNITVIASDGENLEPMETPTLITVAGERFDFVLEANQPVKNYWIRFRGLLDCSVKRAFQVAILHYEGADENEDPEGEVTYENSIAKGFKVNAVNTAGGQNDSLLISELKSLPTEEIDPLLKPEPDVKFYIPYDFYPVNNIHYHNPPYYGYYRALKNQRSRTPQLNHISMQFPNFPLLADVERSHNLEFCNGSSVSLDCRFQFCECPHVLQVPLGAVVEVIMIDEGVPFDANHPFHLHGHAFKLIGMDRLGSSTTEEEVRRLDEEGFLKRNLKNPPIKDTITVPDGGYAIFRFRAVNPGYWILHCHLDFHVELGMALLFKVGDETDFKPPPENLPMCGNSFQPTPVNETRHFFARFHPNKMYAKMAEGIINNTNAFSLSSSALIPLLGFQFVFVTIALTVSNF